VFLGGDHWGQLRRRRGHAPFPNVVLYPRTQVGQRVRIHAGAVIGSDGFGYVPGFRRHRKVPQIGYVVIPMMSKLARTRRLTAARWADFDWPGTKIDNLVQIAHNVAIGEHCLVVAQAGIAGSTKLGKFRHPRRPGRSGRSLKSATKSPSPRNPASCTTSGRREMFGYPAQPDRQTKRPNFGDSTTARVDQARG